MGKITVETCEIEGLKIITPTVFGDARGYFMETYNYNDFKLREFLRCSYRTISPLPRRVYCVDCISRNISSGQAGARDPRRSL